MPTRLNFLTNRFIKAIYTKDKLNIFQLSRIYNCLEVPNNSFYL